MRACVQRVSSASVTVNQDVVCRIGRGMLVLLGVSNEDSAEDAQQLAKKCVELRIFEDESGKMNRSLLEADGSMIVVSQFTLLGDCRKGRRPSFIKAAAPELAEALYKDFVATVESYGADVETGVFRAQMEVALVNDGPVTLLLDSKRTF